MVQGTQYIFMGEAYYDPVCLEFFNQLQSWHKFFEHFVATDLYCS